MTQNDVIEKSLLTWYAKDHPLHLDPLHPAIKLAGECGEFLDLAAKNEYKPGFSWWTCKHCKFPSKERATSKELKSGWYAHTCLHGKQHTPLVLDELGDIWYYLRILMYQFDFEVKQYSLESVDTLLEEMLRMNMSAAKLAVIIEASGNIERTLFEKTYGRFMNILGYLGVSLDEITELNYIKLNSEPTAHGWKGA